MDLLRIRRNERLGLYEGGSDAGPI